MRKNWLEVAFNNTRTREKLEKMNQKDKQGNLSPIYKQNLIEIILDLTDKYSNEQLQGHNTSILTSIVEEETKSLRQ